MAILITALPELSRPHDAFASAFGSLSDRNNQGMDMWTALIKVNLESYDVFLSALFGAPVIDIFCPLFDFRTSLRWLLSAPLSRFTVWLTGAGAGHRVAMNWRMRAMAGKTLDAGRIGKAEVRLRCEPKSSPGVTSLSSRSRANRYCPVRNALQSA